MMEEAKCVYCNSSDNLSMSDIIPDSITTAKCTHKNVCKKCNNKTNSLFENKFANIFAFFRNQLGYTNRRNNEPIPYQVGVYVNREPGLRKKPDFYKKFTTYKNFVVNNLELDGKGIITGMKNVPPKYSKMINPIIGYSYPVNYKELFASNTTFKTIAKICYEWHCKQNNINGVNKRYNRIINYITGNGKSSIEIVEDSIFEEHTIHMLNYVDGSHALYEYAREGERFVLFTLFGAVWYKVKICKDFHTNAKLEEIHQYSLDKTIKLSKSNAMALDLDKSNLKVKKIIKNYFPQPRTIKRSEINIKIALKWAYKMEHLLKGLILSYEEMSRLLKNIESDDYLNKNIYYYHDLINFHENKKIMTCMLLFYISKIGYNYEKSFIENLSLWVEKTQENTNALTFWNNNVIGEKFQSFINIIKDGANIFKSIPPTKI